jgi:hypothetical protein
VDDFAKVHLDRKAGSLTALSDPSNTALAHYLPALVASRDISKMV